MTTEHVLTPDDRCPCGKPQEGSGYCSYECYSKHDLGAPIEPASATAWRADWCPTHQVGPNADFCNDCRVWAIQSAAEHLRDLAERQDMRDVVGATMPTTLAEAATELFAFAEAVKNGDIS